MNTQERLKELSDDFEARSRRKHAEHNLDGYAKIVFRPAFGSYNVRQEGHYFVSPTYTPQSWGIVYLKGNGDYFHSGMTIGHTREEAIEFLEAGRKAFP